MAYDPATHQVVLYGGYTGTGYDNTTWLWNGSAWTEDTSATASAPGDRGYAMMAYDATSGQLVLYGGQDQPGCNGTGFLGDTWIWNGTGWTKATPAVSPPPRAFASMAYDPTNGGLILFGGQYATGDACATGAAGSAVNRSGTWLWAHNNWTKLATTGPSARYGTAMTYDPAIAKMVLFGGTSSSYGAGPGLGDTWLWNGTSWSESLVTGPSARFGAAMHYDPAASQPVLFGGSSADGGGTTPTGTWTFTGTRWLRESPTATPQARFAPSMTYDASSSQLLMFGGQGATLGPTGYDQLNGTYSYNYFAASITASSSTKVTKTGSNEKAGNLTLTLVNPTATASLGTTLTLTLTPTATKWYSTPTVTGHSVTATPAPATNSSNVETITLGSLAAHTTATVTVTNVRYSTTNETGTIKVTPTWADGSFTPTFVVNAYATTKTPAPAATTQSLTATANLPIAKGKTGQTAGTWKLTLKGTKTEGWTATQTIKVVVSPPSGTNCTGGNFVLFTGTPSVKVTATTSVSTTPTFSIKAKNLSPCTVTTDNNAIVLKFTNSGMFNKATGTGSVTVAITGVKYRTGSADGPGNVGVTLDEYPTGTIAGAPNAHIANTFVSANTPAVTVTPSTFDASISPVKVVENTAGSVATGYVCVGLTGSAGATGNHFNTSATATAKATGGKGAVTSKVFYENTTGHTVTSGAAAYAVFKVTTASSTTTPTTYVVSGLAVNAASAGTAKATVAPSTSATNCSAADHGASYGTAVAYTIRTTSTQIYGATADATAAAELASVFPHNGNTLTCAGGTGVTSSTHAVVLARDTFFSDALASQQLAQSLSTGTLLTPKNSLSSVTVTALRLQGIQTVYVVGGPLAISTTVVKALEATPAYKCGGNTPVTNTKTGAQVYLSVQRIYGQTEYGTAQNIAQHVGTAPTATFAGAYSGVNSTGGNGKFNDTAGIASAHPVTLNEPTAILATGATWMDAESASVLSYTKHFPILLTQPTTLTATAANAITNLGVKQVIVMGGQDAVSNAVVKSLMTTMGLSVLRVAGVDYTNTATELAKFETSPTGLDETVSATTALVARGDFYTDGLAGAVIEHGVAASTIHPLLLTENPSTVGTYLTTYLKTVGTGGAGYTHTALGVSSTHHITALTVLGGPEAVQPQTVSQMETDLQH